MKGWVIHMSKAKELQTTTELVKDILTKFPETRNSDDLLYFKVCESINALYISLPFWKVMLNRKEYNFPGFETVRRSRQKIQRECPELAGDENVEAGRMLNEEVFREYAKGGM